MNFNKRQLKIDYDKVVLKNSIISVRNNEFVFNKNKKKKKKINEENFCIPTFKEYNKLNTEDYKIKFLKEICNHYELKKSGNKNELNLRIYNFLYESSKIIKIQSLWKKYILFKYNELKGPARFNPEKCINETDFYSLENIKDIPYNQIYTYYDTINKSIFGFDLISIYNLLFKIDKKSTNPYNRQPFPNKVKEDIKKIKRISKFINEKVIFSIEQPEEISKSKQLELKAVSLFHDIDNLGNYTDAKWFNSLNRVGLIKFMRELIDIWTYRAQLSLATKKEICPPNGEPFSRVNIHKLHILNYELLKTNILNIINIFINNGVNNESKILGSNYVLCALTLVNNDAATSLPWLYQSVAPI